MPQLIYLGRVATVVLFQPCVVLLALQDVKRKRYDKMWYKTSEGVGIRRKFDERGPVKKGKQIFTFGNGVDMTQEQKMKIGNDVLQKLEDGMSEADAKKWAEGKCK